MLALSNAGLFYLIVARTRSLVRCIDFGCVFGSESMFAS